MRNKSKTLLIIFAVGVIAIGLVGGYIQFFVNKASTTTSLPDTKISIKEDIFESIVEPSESGPSQITNRDGFGRSNPFAPYK